MIFICIFKVLQCRQSNDGWTYEAATMVPGYGIYFWGTYLIYCLDLRHDFNADQDINHFNRHNLRLQINCFGFKDVHL